MKSEQSGQGGAGKSSGGTEAIEPRPRLQFQDAVIERVNLNGDELEIVFSSIPAITVNDAFGFEFEPRGLCGCVITMKNPQYEYLPRPGVVADGHVALGELCYISIFPPDLALDCPCFLMIEQPGSGEDDEESETFMIVADQLDVVARLLD